MCLLNEEMSTSGGMTVVVKLYPDLDISFFIRVRVNSRFTEYTFVFSGLRRIIGHAELSAKNTTNGCAKGVNRHLTVAAQMPDGRMKIQLRRYAEILGLPELTKTSELSVQLIYDIMR
jgi:hypothetical protein